MFYNCKKKVPRIKRGKDEKMKEGQIIIEIIERFKS